MQMSGFRQQTADAAAGSFPATGRTAYGKAGETTKTAQLWFLETGAWQLKSFGSILRKENAPPQNRGRTFSALSSCPTPPLFPCSVSRARIAENLNV